MVTLAQRELTDVQAGEAKLVGLEQAVAGGRPELVMVPAGPPGTEAVVPAQAELGQEVVGRVELVLAAG